MNNYDWSCLACSATNAGDLATCSVCGCPARSTVKQQAHFRQELLEADAEVVPFKPVLVLEPLTPAVANALRKIRINVYLRLAAGALMALSMAWFIFSRYAHWLDDRHMAPVVGGAVLGLFFYPAFQYLSRLKCPRCCVPWKPPVFTEAKHGKWTSWVVSNWRQCSHCGLSISRIEPLAQGPRDVQGP